MCVNCKESGRAGLKAGLCCVGNSLECQAAYLDLLE